MSDKPVINIHPEETSHTSATSYSSSGSEKPLIPHERNRPLTAFVVVISLIFVWAIALLPAYFYANKLPAPPEPKVNMSILPNPTYPCNHPLVFNEKTKMCEPPCPWVILSESEDFARKVVDNFSVAVSLLSFVIILATWIRIKQLRSFPHIIPLYIQGLSAAISFLVAVGNGMGRKKAFCTSKLFSEAHENPTTFCKAQGILIHYFQGALALWFLVYCINLIQMICYESLVSVQGHKYKVKHIICSLICWLLPCIPVGIVLGSKTTNYNVMNMRVCYPNGTDTGFFMTTFITEISQGVGCTCLLVVVYKLFMVTLIHGGTAILTILSISLLPRDIEILLPPCIPRHCNAAEVLKGTMLGMYSQSTKGPELFFLQFRDTPAVVGEQAKLRKKKMNKVVKRLVFLMCAYAVTTALTFTPICALQQHAKLLDYYVKQYFGCLIFLPPERCPKTYEKHTFSAATIVSTLSSALFALSTVCFLAFNKQSRKLWIFWWNRAKNCCCN